MKIRKELFASLNLIEIDVEDIPPTQHIQGRYEDIEKLVKALQFITHIFNKFQYNNKIDFLVIKDFYEIHKESANFTYHFETLFSLHPNFIKVKDGRGRYFVIPMKNKKRKYICFSCGYWQEKKFVACKKCGRYLVREIERNSL